MIVGTMVGISFLALPRIAAASSQQDAWIAVVIGSLLPLLVLLLIERLGRRFPDMDFIEMSQALFGKLAGSLLVAILGIHMLLAAVTVTIRFAYVDSIYLLQDTPMWAICLLILLASMYVAGHGGKVVARINELMFYIYLPTLLLFLPFLLNLSDYTNLLPVGESGLGNIARGSFDASLYFGRMEFLMVAYFMVTRRDEVLKAGVSALTYITMGYLALTLACLLALGPENLPNHISPMLGLFKAVSFPIMERIDMFFIAVWSVAFRPVFNLLCLSAFSFTRLFNLQEKKRAYLLILIAIGSFAYLLTFIPRSALDVIQYTDGYVYTYPAVGLGYPLLYHLAATLRGRKVPSV